MSETTERDQIIQLTHLLKMQARHLRSSCFVGDPCEEVAKRAKRMTDVRVGDWVIEISSFQAADDLSNIGQLLAIEVGEFDTIYEIESIDGSVHRWSNARFMMLFDTREVPL